MQNNRTTVHFALELFREYPRRTLLVFACYVAAGFGEIIGISALLPILVLAGSVGRGNTTSEPTMLERVASQILDVFGQQPTLGPLLLLLIASLTAKSLLTFFANTQAGYASADVATTIRLRLAKALTRARWRLFVSQPIGKLAAGMGPEADNSAQAYSAACQCVAMGIQSLIYTAAAFLISWKLTAASAGVGLLLIVILGPFVIWIRKAGARWAKATSQLAQKLVDGFTGFKALKAMGREDQLYARLADEIREIQSATYRWTKVNQGRVAIEEPILAVFVAIGLYVYLATNPVPFEALILMVGLFLRGVTRLTMLQKSYGAVAHLETFYRQLTETIGRAEADVEKTSGQPAPVLNAPIAFENVQFSYGDHDVFSNLDLTIAPNELTVIFGPSGTGKSTVVDLLVGLSQPAEGRITVAGVPLNQIDLKTWRARIGFVPQEVLLFNQSIFHNVTLGDLTLGALDVEAALREAGAWDFVSAMPNGIDTIVGERGSRLSGGQRQRVAIARALVRKPELLILDEATAALDVQTEREIWTTLKEMSGTHTILAITHQPAVLGLADAVYRLADGRCVSVPRSQLKAS